MFKKIFLFLTILLFLFLLVAPAQAGMLDTLMKQLGIGRAEEAGFVTPPTTAETVIVNVIMWIMSILGIIAVGFIIYGGIMYATSAGNEQQIERAKKILLYAIIGLVIAILALAIAQVVTVVVRGGNYCLVCRTYDPETHRTYEAGTPYQTQDECYQAQLEAQDSGLDCRCYTGSCPPSRTY